jgi:4-hydroxy 2-oxovalerate aldolase
MKKIYPKEVKLIDCTIRDGGLINNFRFQDDMVRSVYSTCNKAGIDYMEIGYKASEEYFSYNEFGKWKFCKEEDIKRILGEEKSNTKLSVMLDVGRTNMKDILPVEKSMIDMVRVAAYINQIEEAIEMIKVLSNRGYKTSLNLMAVSKVNEVDLENMLRLVSNSEVNVVCIVDSFGALYTDDIKDLTYKYMKYLNVQGKQVGIHAHNNRQMACANTIEAIKCGATYVDATMAGLGRGAGNCNMELILGYLNYDKSSIKQVIKCIQEYIIPLKEKVKWGPDMAYMLTGQYNVHPRSAISFLKEDNMKNYIEFFEHISEI